MLSPRQIFEDNIRPAELMLRVYRLIEHDTPKTDGEMVQALRVLVKAKADEGLMVIYNEIFIGTDSRGSPDRSPIYPTECATQFAATSSRDGVHGSGDLPSNAVAVRIAGGHQSEGAGFCTA